MQNSRVPLLSSLAVALLLISTPASARLVGTLEEPAAGGECNGVRNIRGWVYSTTGSELLQPFQVYIDGKRAIDVPCCSSRGDVSAARADAPTRSGFSGVMNFGLLTPARHQIDVKIKSRGGEELTLSASCISRRIGGATRLRNLDLDNDGEGYCETDLDDPRLVCCEGVRTDGPGGPQICKNVCYRWDPATQGMVMSAGPVLANPQCQAAQ